MEWCKWEGGSKIRPLTSDECSDNNVHLGINSTPEYAMDHAKMTATQALMTLLLPPLLDTNIGPYCPPQVRNTPHLHAFPIINMESHGYQACFAI